MTSLNVLVDKASSPPALVKELDSLVPISVVNLGGTGYLDFLWWAEDGHSITVERKTVSDLSGRVDDLELQLKRALQTADEVVLLIEGVMVPEGGATRLFTEGKYRSGFILGRKVERPYAYYQGFLWRIDKLGVSNFATANSSGTARFIAEAAVASQSKDFRTFARYIRPKPPLSVANPQVMKLMGLGVGETRAKALIEKFGTVWKVLNTKPEKLVTVPGVGKKTAEDLLQGVGRKI